MGRALARSVAPVILLLLAWTAIDVGVAGGGLVQFWFGFHWV